MCRCSYDYLEIWEGGNCSWRKCGDWSERLKLLRYVSSRGHIHLAFVSDYSHHYGGFKARLSIEHEWIRDPRVDEEAEESLCLSLQWTSSPSALLPSGLYWQPQSCDMVGGYVCKKHNQESAMDLNLNVTLNETEGRLTSPFYPLAYSHNLDYWVTIVGPEQTRIVFKFSRLDLEAQAHCLYDFLELHDTGPHLSRQPHRLCGHYDHHDMEKLRLVSSNNVAMLHFRSDYSVSGGGYALTWRAVDTSWCPMQTLTAKEGVITSPNYPHYLLPHLDCSTTILAPEGKRVWLELKEFDVETEDAVVEVVVGGGAGRLQPHSRRGLLSDGVYVSSGERMQIILKTGDKPLGRGFRAVYRTGREDEEEERTVELKGNSSGHYLHINYPLNPPQRLTYTDRLLAPVGHSIHLQFHNSAFTLCQYCHTALFKQIHLQNNRPPPFF
ncbi:hypothetical protein AAG570_013390 [Ranatra chinensis]|uniref:CUB domain-containing protein n=1 Tax=Ranatra chinensis TaxID=642074 RepID=A0ABD0YCB2_9HEMI